MKLYHLAVNLRAICDNNKNLLLEVMPRLGLDEQEFRSIVESACKEQPKGLSKTMREIIGNENQNSQLSTINSQLNDWGEQIEALSVEFPLLKDICKGLKRNQFPAALFVSGGLLMTLMTRCTYRFYHRPEELRRLNNSTLIIGDPACGKSFATRLFKLLAAPIVAADKVGKDAINAYRELMKTKGANKEKPKKPKVVVRVHPARTSNAQFIQDMVNAVEVVDGEEMQLHMLTFDTELDNTVSVQKGGSWIDKFSMELKAFHNEEDGQAYSNVDSIMQDFIVTWNFIYTGTPIALKKKVNEQNFGSGLATRLTCIPLPATNIAAGYWFFFRPLQMSFNNGNSSLSASICAPQSHSHCAISSSFSVTAVCVCAFVISRNVLPVAFWIASCIAFEKKIFYPTACRSRIRTSRGDSKYPAWRFVPCSKTV